LLAQAGYQVEVAEDPAAALRLHAAGECFDLIMADTSVRGGEARRFAETFAQADRWHTTPLLGLGLHRQGGAGLFDESTLLAAVSGAVSEDEGEQALRGAA
jgi:CheY-like chemotaxis protein